jgi:hypothetical protein
MNFNREERDNCNDRLIRGGGRYVGGWWGLVERGWRLVERGWGLVERELERGTRDS